MITEKKAAPRFWLIINVVVVGLLLFLPYYLFGGRLFLGGDDTRIFYAYPREVMQSLAIFSWNTISSLSSYTPNHHFFPFLFALSGLEMLIPSKTVLFYFTFSLPLILGFIYFQKFVLQIIKDEYFSAFVVALLYILSPVTMFSQLLYFLSPAWLIALFPIYAYYFLMYLKHGYPSDVYKAAFWAILFSFANMGIPWLGGHLLPFIPSVIFVIVRDRHAIFQHLKRSIVFGISLVISQLFWVVPFIVSFIYRGDLGLAARVTDAAATFVATVNGTATGNVIYPLLTFYHRQYLSDINQPLIAIFTNYYDYILPLSLIFVAILALGILRYKKVFRNEHLHLLHVFLIAFLAALYFFTVNIGVLKDVFMLMGHIPGFGMFRNFTDKFALGYIFVYSSLLYICFYIIRKTSKFYSPILVTALIAVLLNAIPVKQIVDSPLWTTKDISRTINIPPEYLSFMEDIRKNISPAGQIFSLPQNIASYSIITEDDGKHTYVGVSPVKFFTGVNDLSGSGSYPPQIEEEIKGAIMEKKYEKLLTTLQGINVSHVMVTNNTPKSVQKSYMYNAVYLSFQDQTLVEAIVDKEMLRSTKGNYVLYQLKDPPVVITSSGNIEIERISPVHYEVTVRGLSSSQKLLFRDTYHPGWKVYPLDNQLVVTEDNGKNALPVFGKALFESSHTSAASYGNEWVLDPSLFKSLGNSYYSENADGSINTKIALYFQPQIFFYIGSIMTVVSLISLFVYLSKRKP